MKAKRYILFVSIVVFCSLVFSSVGAQQVATPFPVGEMLLQNVNASEMVRNYQFRGLEQESLFLLAVSQDYTNTPQITLTDNSTNRTMAMVQVGISGMCLRIAPGVETYTLSMTNANPPTTQFYGLLLLRNLPTVFTCDEDAMSNLANAVNGASESSGSLFETISSDGSDGASNNPVNPNNPGGTGCEVMSASLTQGVNIRALTDIQSPIISNLRVGNIIPVNGIVEARDWLLVNNSGASGFVSRVAVEMGGDCSQVPVVAIEGSAVVNTGVTSNLGVFVNLEAGSTNASLNVDATVGGEDGINVGANVNAGTGGVEANVNVGDSTIANIGVNVGDEAAPIIEAEVPAIETEVSVGSKTCVIILGVPIIC